MNDDIFSGVKFRVHPITEIKHSLVDDGSENSTDYQENNDPSGDGESDHEEN